jgi:hypothetical protein
MVSTQSRWLSLFNYYSSHFPNSTLQCNIVYHANEPLFEIKETSKLSSTLLFHFTRSAVTLQRRTLTNLFSIVGLTTLSSFDKVFVTEGVSDFLALKCMTTLQVIGITNLKGSPLARQALSLFSSLVFIADNDSPGISTVSYYKSQFPNSKVFIPTNKDISEDLFSPLRNQVLSRLSKL